MVKTIRKFGNSNAIPLDNRVMKSLKLRTGDKVKLTVSGNQLIVTPANDGLSRERVSKSIAKFRRRYNTALKQLAK